jgi:hypothetical protein
MAGTVYVDEKGQPYQVGPDGRKIPVAGKPSLADIAAPLAVDKVKDVALSKLPEGGSLSLSGIGSAGNYIAPGLGLLGAYDLATNDRGKVGGALQGAASGAAIGSFFPGPGTAIGAGIGGLAGLAKGFFQHKGTKEYQADNTASLAKTFQGAPADQQKLLQSLRNPDPNAPKATKESQALAMKDPTAMWGSYGMLNTFGKDYFDKMDEFQRYAATQAAIDNNLFDPEKGDMLITDPAKLKALTEGAYKNADYRKAYDAWKKTEGKASLSSIAPGAGDPQVAAANVMADAQKQIANQSAQQTKQQNLLGILSQAQGQNQRVADYKGFTGAKNPYL